MAQAAQGQDIDLQQVLLVGPFMGKEGPVGALACAVDQQVDAPLAFLQLSAVTTAANPNRAMSVRRLRQW